MVEALEGSEPRVFWLDSPDAPEPLPSLEGERRCRLAVVGGGFTGLWAALLAAERGEDVALLEADRCGWGASRRNGGFLEASLTRGSRTGCRAGRRRSTGSSRWPRASTRSAGSRRRRKRRGPHGEYVLLLDREAMRAEVDSPTYLAGLRQRGRERDGRSRAARLGPAPGGARGRGADIRAEPGAQAWPRRGRGASGDGAGPAADRAGRARHERLSAAPALDTTLRDPGLRLLLVTEPLSASRRAAVGWERRQGLADSGNRFHYYRLTPDDRSLWGGNEAIYHFRNGMAPRLEEHRPTFELLARNFARTFPQLEGIRFTHRWAGAIDTCSRFCVTFGPALGGRAAYAVGYTGLGVGASRFGARVALDLVHGRDTELTRLGLVRSRPIPSRPNRSATGPSRPPAAPSPAPTSGAGAAARRCNCLTASAPASTADGRFRDPPRSDDGRIPSPDRGHRA